MMINQVFTKKQTMIPVTIRELTIRLQENTLIAREVSQSHVRAIKRYILENVQKEQIYFPPIVVHLEGNLENEEYQIFSIIDGSHRMKAFLQIQEIAQNWINSENEEEMKKGYNLIYLISSTKVSLQIFQGLEEKDQLYIDLNTKGKKVSLSIRIAYNSRNYINQITNYVLQLNENLQIAGVEMEKAAIIRPGNKKLLSLM